MLIQCTKSLLDQIGIKESELSSSEGHEQYPDSFMAWHANYVTIDRKKAIVLMNNETRYPVVIYRPRKKDFSNIKVLILEAISETLHMEGVNKEIIDRYLAKAGEISFSKTASKSIVGKMNNAVREIEVMQEYLNEETRVQRYISLVAGRLIQLSKDNKGFYPIEKMLTCLNRFYYHDNHEGVANVLDIDLYQLRIKINIESHEIWRRVLVPSTFSFRHLHNIIQTVFDWHNYHLHEFVVERTDGKSIKIIMDEDPETIEYLEFDVFDIRQERFIALEDIFPTFGEVTYEYDFGDSWLHTITFEKIIKSNALQATFVDGIGERPPEDVGGEWGYEDYLQIVANEKHPEHENRKAWAESQKARMLNPEEINRRLKRTLSSYRYSKW